MDGMVQETIVIFAGLLVAFCIFIFASSKGWVKNLKFGKSGMEVQGVEKQKRSGSLNKLLYDQFVALDTEAMDYALKTVNGLHDNLVRYLDKDIPHPAGRRVIAGAVRFALYSIYRKSDFKRVLCPENMRGFIDSCILEIRLEFEESVKDQKYVTCPMRGEGSCFQYPKFEEILSPIRQRLMQDSILPLRSYQIRIHEKKVALNKQFIPSFAELEDFVRVDIAKEDIERNEMYIAALSRKPNEDNVEEL